MSFVSCVEASKVMVLRPAWDLIWDGSQGWHGNIVCKMQVWRVGRNPNNCHFQTSLYLSFCFLIALFLATYCTRSSIYDAWSSHVGLRKKQISNSFSVSVSQTSSRPWPGPVFSFLSEWRRLQANQLCATLQRRLVSRARWSFNDFKVGMEVVQKWAIVECFQ